MFQFDITKWTPRFLLNDKNGYALAKAIEAALQMMNDTIDEGVNCVIDYETMPEWRLDELAWELNCLYDYHADVETKRKWIINATPYYRLYGTPEAIRKYIGSYFDNIEVEENWIYNGSPYHFRVFVDGTWNPANEAWARKTIDKAKNVRSVLDSLAIGCNSYIAMMAEGEVLSKFAYPLTGPSNWAGRWPQENYIGVLDESGQAGVQGDAPACKFPYPMAGTRPEINTLGVLDDGGRAGLSGEAPGYLFGYPMTSENVSAGTIPQENMIGAISENNIQSAQAEDAYYAVLYKMCGQDEM